MPKLHDDTLEVDIWFERGMIYFQDPKNPENCASCTVNDFEERMEVFRTYVDDDNLLSKFVCGKQAARRFIVDTLELIREAKAQLHVGMDIDVIAGIERERACVSRRQGFEARSSGLIVPCVS